MLIFLLLIFLPFGECFWQQKLFRKIKDPSVRNAFERAFHRGNPNFKMNKRKVIGDLHKDYCALQSLTDIEVVMSALRNVVSVRIGITENFAIVDLEPFSYIVAIYR